MPTSLLAHDALSPVVTDGVRYAAYEESASTTRVIDTTTGNSYVVYTPPGCSSYQPGFGPRDLAAVGGGELIWSCGQMLDLATRTVHEPADYAAYQTRTEDEGRPIDVGAHWIRFALYTNHVNGVPSYLNWHTGMATTDDPGTLNDTPPDVFEPSVFPDLNAPGLVHALCPPVTRKRLVDEVDTEVGPSIDPELTEQSPWTADGTRVQRCGASSKWSLAKNSGASQLGAGLVSFGWPDATGAGTVHLVRLGSGQQWAIAGHAWASHTATRLYGAVEHGAETGLPTFDLVEAEIPPPPPFAGALRPDVAIGPVALGERRARVRRSLGPGQADPQGRVVYATPALRLTVTYGPHGRVTRVATSTSRVQLNGYPLAAGYAFFHAALTRWHASYASRSQVLWSPHRSDAPTTVLYWRDGALVDAAVSALPVVHGVLRGRVQHCQSLPPGRCVAQGSRTLVALCARDGRPVRRVRADRRGRFTFRVRPGRYIVAEGTGHQVLDWRRVRVRLERPTRVTLTSDPLGRPVPRGQPSCLIRNG